MSSAHVFGITGTIDTSLGPISKRNSDIRPDFSIEIQPGHQAMS
jgi:hypothetical protein